MTAHLARPHDSGTIRRRPPSAVRRPPSAVRRPPSAVRRPPSAATGGQWTVTGALSPAREGATATVLADGDVVVAGDEVGSGGSLVPTGAVERYDAAHGTGSAESAVPSGLAVTGAAAARIADGKVLVAGGLTKPTGGAAGVTDLSEEYGTGTPPVVTSAGSLALHPGACSSFTVTATGSPTPTPTLSLSGRLPAGMSFRPRSDGTATISGTPAPYGFGTYVVDVTASNGVGSPALRTLRITVSARFAPRITSPAAPGLHVGKYARFDATASGDPVPRISLAGRLPLGMSFVDDHDGTAYVLGAPKAAAVGSYAVTVTATHGIGAPAHQTLHLYVAFAPGTPAPTPAPAPAARATGCWYVTTTGRVVHQGSATLFATRSRQGPPEIAAMQPTRDGRGCYLVTSTGNVHNFGDANFHGSSARTRLPGAVVGFAVAR